MFLKIIHKSEATYLCCYHKSSYTESIGRSFSTQYLYPKIFTVREYSGRFQDCAKYNPWVGTQLSNQRSGYHKQLLLEQHSFKNQLFLWLHLARKHYTGS